ncbi:MAG: GH39 family glycosyl hydrolase [Verrucomicrobiales bacterium]
MRKLRILILLLFCLSALSLMAGPLELRILSSSTNEVIRPLHGINKGPLAPGGLIDLTPELTRLKIPSIRLHDCHWPNPDVVDIHALFPDFNADPAQSSSYRFEQTDEYIQACLNTGARIVFRLGESIEHTKVKRFVHPPPDPEKWAKICIGIIRHYNDGWANGFKHGITHWEIWNEPDNRPAMWTGNDDQFLELYITAARQIKAAFPHLKIGGPAFGHSGQYRDGTFTPSPFVLRFLEMCKSEGAPLDFFSWHCYTDDPSELVGRAKAVRKLLDDYGFTKTESHLNEWNYLPGNNWGPLGRKVSAEEREAFYLQMGGLPGAAFVASSLVELQAAPVDTSNLFHGELGGFGLFNEFGSPNKVYQALELFSYMLQTPRRLQVEASPALPANLHILAGLSDDGKSARVFVINRGELLDFNLALPGGLFGQSKIVCEIKRLGEDRRLQNTSLDVAPANRLIIPLSISKNGVALLEFKKAADQ